MIYIKATSDESYGKVVMMLKELGYTESEFVTKYMKENGDIYCEQMWESHNARIEVTQITWGPS